MDHAGAATAQLAAGGRGKLVLQRTGVRGGACNPIAATVCIMD